MSAQDGGKLLAQGIDGCIFIPKLKCKGNSTDFLKASQLMVDKLTSRKDAEKEYGISKKIAKIPLAKNYFIFSESICTPESIDKQKEPELKSCEVIQNLKNMKILRMPYGGISLPDYNFIFKTLSPIEFTKHLLESGALLALNGIVHNDIHMGNILVDENQVPRIIDFSRSLFVYENIQERDLLVETAVKSPHLCPDFSLLNDRILGYTQDLVIKNYIQYQQPLIDSLRIFYGSQVGSHDKIIKQFEEFALLSSSYQKLDLIGWFNHHWRTIDSWAVGFALVSLFSAFIYFNDFMEIWEKKGEGMVVLPVIRRLLEVDPFRRIDCVQGLDMICRLIGEDDNIIIKKYGKSWLDKVGRV